MTITPDDATTAAEGLLAEVKTLHLATVSSAGWPEASYAPFVAGDGALHVYLSRLAAHTANLLTSGRASVLLIRDEERCEDPFARPRLMLRCDVAEVAKADPRRELALDRFERKFGRAFAPVRPLPDFHLLRLVPRDGRLVEGFARAHRLRGDALRSLLGPASAP